MYRDPVFSNLEDMVGSILGYTPERGKVSPHRHNADCAAGCEGWTFLLDLVGDGNDNDDLSSEQYIARAELPPGLKAVLELAGYQYETEAATQQLRGTLREAWLWQGKPSEFIWHVEFTAVDRFPHSANVVVTSPDLTFTNCGSESLNAALGLRGERSGPIYLLAAADLSLAAQLSGKRLFWRYTASIPMSVLAQVLTEAQGPHLAWMASKLLA